MRLAVSFVLVFSLASNGIATKLQASNFLRVDGKNFMYGDDIVYLSGTNAAWIQYGNDFGNGQWDSSTGSKWTNEIKLIGDSGGNSVRVWVHVEGDNNPQFSDDGYVLGTDGSDTLVSDLRKLADVCQDNDIFLIPVLWNGALMRNQNVVNLFYDDAKMESYIDNALTPMVEGLKDHPAIGAWEIMNEPEGSISMLSDSEPCYDTTHLDWTREASEIRGPGWSGANLKYNLVLKFLNVQASAIRRADSKALITVGSWSEWSQTDSSQVMDDPQHKYGFNHYKDECLIKAGGQSDGILSFWQFHNYPYNNQWDTGAPWSGHQASDYQMDAPLVVGEFPVESLERSLPNGDTTGDLAKYVYENGFNGGWSWCLGCDGNAQHDQDVAEGLEALKGRNDHGQIDITIQ